ncbi:hypothetical protein ACIRVF_32625 [Kitasatospora sp. NPDC101157]|uniref:hypothetical protein n=1 Tax=Kitasatospora sp. NPDC101157 TaxID=3364098 RepID=UPI0038274BDA
MRATPSTPTPSTSRSLSPGGGRQPNRWASGTAAFSALPRWTAGPEGAPVAWTPGCCVSVMSKKSPFTAATAPRSPASRVSGARAATAPGRSRSARTPGRSRSARTPGRLSSARTAYTLARPWAVRTVSSR